MTIRSALAKALAAAALFIACAGVRAGEITVYTALEEDDVRVYLASFAKAKPDIKVNVLRLSTGDLVARILAEKSNPRHDVIWGTALTQVNDPRILEMAEAYKPAGIDSVKTQFKDPQNLWFATTGYFAGFCVNTEVLKKRNLPMPTSWQDLLNPVYKGQIVMPNAASSGTGYLQIVSLLQAPMRELAYVLAERGKGAAAEPEAAADPAVSTAEPTATTAEPTATTAEPTATTAEPTATTAEPTATTAEPTATAAEPTATAADPAATTADPTATTTA